MTNRCHIRSMNQLDEDLLSPSQGLSYPEEDCRHAAVVEVLCRIPAESYETLTERVDDFHWFIPPDWAGAKIYPFPWTTKGKGLKPYAKVIYLSPLLERRSFDIVVAVVAHELVHLVLGHKLFWPPEEYDPQKGDAWRLVRQWGFEREEKKHEASWRRYYTRQKTLLARLKKEMMSSEPIEDDV